MNRREFLSSTFAAACGAAQSGASAPNRPPNFVIVLADDLGYGDLAIYGSPTIRTPNLDRMAFEGVRFTSFCSTPTCTPSRAALMTGRYPIRSGLVRVLHPGDKFGLPESEITLAQALKEKGYATACIGKWHLGGPPPFRPTRRGFDHYYGLLYSNDMNLMPPDMRRLRLWRNEEPVEWPVKQATLTKRYTEEALRFIERNKSRPFLLYLAHSMPHVPLHVAPEFRGKSHGGIYGDVVEEMDFRTGEILSAIREHGLDDNTLVIFTSDNGPAVAKGARGGSAGPFRGSKHTAWEGGVRVPFVARWPGQIPGGRIRHGVATLMDLFPTLVELAGGQVPSDRAIDGKNILPMLTGTGDSPHSEYFYYLGRRIYAVRSGDWKAHFFKRKVGLRGIGPQQKCDSPELYDLAVDPGERFNLADEHPQIVTRLTELAQEFEQSVEPGKLPGPVRPRLPLIG